MYRYFKEKFVVDHYCGLKGYIVAEMFEKRLSSTGLWLLTGVN